MDTREKIAVEIAAHLERWQHSPMSLHFSRDEWSEILAALRRLESLENAMRYEQDQLERDR